MAKRRAIIIISIIIAVVAAVIVVLTRPETWAEENLLTAHKLGTVRERIEVGKAEDEPTSKEAQLHSVYEWTDASTSSTRYVLTEETVGEAEATPTRSVNFITLEVEDTTDVIEALNTSIENSNVIFAVDADVVSEAEKALEEVSKQDETVVETTTETVPSRTVEPKTTEETVEGIQVEETPQLEVEVEINFDDMAWNWLILLLYITMVAKRQEKKPVFFIANFDVILYKII